MPTHFNAIGLTYLIYKQEGLTTWKLEAGEHRCSKHVHTKLQGIYLNTWK